MADNVVLAWLVHKPSKLMVESDQLLRKDGSTVDSGKSHGGGMAIRNSLSLRSK